MRSTGHLILTVTFAMIILAALSYSIASRAREESARAGAIPAEPPLPAALDTLAPPLRDNVEKQAAAVRAAPADGAQRGTLGMVYHANGLFESAETCYTQAIRLQPREGRWFYYRALVREKLQHDDDAALDYKRVTQLNEGFAPAFVRLGELHLRHDRIEEATTPIRFAERLAPDDPAMLYVLSDLYIRTDQAALAQSLLEERVAAQPGDLFARHLLGRALSKLGKEEEARRMFEGASDLRPNWTDEWLFALSRHRVKPVEP